MKAILFGCESDREMVGYAFYPDGGKVKMLSRTDCGTVRRWWYKKDLNDLYSIVGYSQKIIYKNFYKFIERVNQQPYVVNEALVKLNRGHMFAIVIAKDTPRAREIAITRNSNLKCRLPILFYNPEYQHSRIYTSVEQRRDFPQLFLPDISAEIYSEVNSIARDIAEFDKNFQAIDILRSRRQVHINMDFGYYLVDVHHAMLIRSVINDIEPATANIAVEKILENSGAKFYR